MKKRICTISRTIIFILAALLAGCVSPAEFIIDSASQSESSSETAVHFSDYVYDPESAGYYTGTHAAVREDGYYLVINRVLYFFDIQLDTLFPLCTKASCLHKDQTCDGYIYDFSKSTGYNGWSSNARDNRIYYDGGNRYIRCALR